MGVSISGLVSNMDTDTIIQQLVSAYSYKKDTYVKAQTKLEWKQDAWKALNTKIYSFYKNQLSPMRFSDAFATKKATSTSTKATVTASNSAVNGTQSLKISKLATSGYLTGGVVATTSGDKLAKTSKLSELGVTDGSKFEVTTNGTTSVIEVGADTTVNDFLIKLKDAGLQASFDETNQRFFVNSKVSGAAGDFNLVAANDNGTAALKNLGLFSTTQSDMDSYTTLANYTADELKAIVDAAYDKQKTALYDKTDTDAMISLKETTQKNYESLKEETKNLQSTTDYLKNCKNAVDAYNSSNYSSKTEEEKQQFMDNLDSSIATLSEKSELTDEEAAQLSNLKAQKEIYTNYEIYTDEDKSKYEDTLNTTISANDEKLAANNDQLDVYNAALADDAGFDAYVDSLNSDITDSNNTLYSNLTSYYQEKQDTAKEYQQYIDIINDPAADKTSTDYLNAMSQLGLSSNGGSGAIRIAAQDAVIELNGATFTSNTNTFQINGLTIQANAVTDEDENISITTASDTQGIYDMVKNFFSEYNKLINEMDSLYNADSAKGYEPLTDDEKDGMTDSQIEKWEDKIKAALLRRDSTLDSVSYAMKSAFQKSYVINGKTYSLSSFGIKTAGYFSSSDNEKSAYHIDGDKDDSVSSANTDQLLAKIASDPDAATSFFNQLSSDVYKALDDKMKSTSLRSIYTVYNDKQMATEYKEYTKTISKWETKISEYEERYRKQFTAMETAMATLNSQQSSLSSLLG